MRLRFYTTILSLIVVILSYSQEANVIIQTDSTVLAHDTYVSSPITTQRIFTRLYSPYQWSPGTSMNLYDQSLTISSNVFNQNAIMPRITNLGGYVTSTSLPGLMGIESGALSYELSTGGFSFTPAVYVDKYGYYGGLTTSLGVGGQMSFKINDRFSITAFGSYHTNSWSANPAVMSNMMSSRFGGYGTWNINDSWSISTGVQRVYNSATNRWENVPIAMPTFKINGKDAIAIDIGGILYEIVDTYRNKKAYNHGNQPIAPPVRPQGPFPPHR